MKDRLLQYAAYGVVIAALAFVVFALAYSGAYADDEDTEVAPTATPTPIGLSFDRSSGCYLATSKWQVFEDMYKRRDLTYPEHPDTAEPRFQEGHADYAAGTWAIAYIGQDTLEHTSKTGNFSDHAGHLEYSNAHLSLIHI